VSEPGLALSPAQLCDGDARWTGRVIAASGGVRFVRTNTGGLLALHGGDVDAFPFSLLVDPSAVARLSVGRRVQGAGRALFVDDTAVDLRTPIEPGVGRGAARPLSLDRATDLLAVDVSSCPLPLDRVEALGRAMVAGSLGVAVRRLVGLGPGLTPAGDDLLVGAVVALQTCGPTWGLKRVGRLAALLGEVRPEQTTMVSAALLRCAADGRFAAPVERVRRALRVGDELLLSDAVERLRGVGASTGNATLCGMRLVVETARWTSFAGYQ
jgi:hypothetical protein